MATEPIPILDDVVRMQKIDKRNLLRLINELPEQCETALGIANNLALEAFDTTPDNVYITGIGDSATAAVMASTILSEYASIPVITGDGVKLPEYVGENSLVIVMDYTGKSNSALRNMRSAKSRGASVICLSGSGRLMEQAAKDGIGRFTIPPGQPLRTAFGYLLLPIIVTIERLGLVKGEVEKLSHAIKLMKNAREVLRFENPTVRNKAKQIAHRLHGKLPMIYGCCGHLASVARRWKSQICSNSKMLACSGTVLDLLSGDITGYELISRRADEIGIVLLHNPIERSPYAHLVSAVEETLDQFDVIVADVQGATITEKMFYGLYLGDYVSYYLALLNEVDPLATEYAQSLEAKVVGSFESQAPAPPVTPANQEEA
ncbi:MAG: SIS domain-containing protein [Armatimonadetes bacterium]|nr:SIS domain-containing protein [Armatimonadota bacterium]